MESKKTLEEYEQQGMEKYAHEFKQETTLEEAACLVLGYAYDLWVSVHSKDQSSLIYIEVTNWCKGAKWQAERMYGEGEIHKIVESYQNTMENNPTYITYNQWFEQFKKK
jgi:hypothetical protein